MRNGQHYVVEVLVILLGITVSVTLEKNNARDYKREVMDQRLTRILANLRQDSLDLRYNIGVPEVSQASCQWMTEHRSPLNEQHPDSVGKHCAICIQAQTIFVDNPEEYRTLQHSGLLEFIDTTNSPGRFRPNTRSTHSSKSSCPISRNLRRNRMRTCSAAWPSGPTCRSSGKLRCANGTGKNLKTLSWSNWWSWPPFMRCTTDSC